MSYCDQAFFVQDEEGYPLKGARVDLGYTIYYTTNSVGYCWARDLLEGDTYTATAQKPGTHSGNPSRTFTACRSKIVFTLTSKYCDQDFKVEDQNGNPVAGAKIDLGGTIYYTTDSAGKCTIKDLYKGGDPYTATVKKSGYTKNSTTFTACTAEIVFTIIKQYCDQDFKVEDQNGNPLAGAKIDIGYTIYYTTDYAGHCTIRDLKIGDSYTAGVKKSGYISGSPKSFTACTTEIVFELAKGASLTFRVQTPERVKLPNATIKIQNDTTVTCKTDNYGECEITVAVPFEGTATASHPSYRKSYPIELNINTYESLFFFVRVLPTVCTQSFIVATEDETRLENAEVTMQDAETRAYINSAETDGNGECQISFTALYFKAKACCAGYECQEYKEAFQCDPGSEIFFHLIPKPEEVAAPGAQQIVTKNAEAMAEAVVTRYDGLTLPGFSDPPHTCPICGKSFNNTGEFMGHIGDHISAYEEQNKQWL